ncbi:MAG: glycoside hydrolase family 20 zincin-like fold domain-containing protein [Acidobacteriota bacterium]
MGKTIFSFLGALLVVAYPCSLSSKALPEPSVISSKSPASIVVPAGDSPVGLRAVEVLADYLERVTGSRPPILNPSQNPRSGTRIVLREEPDRTARPDAYQLICNRNPREVTVTASGPEGLKYGVYRLIREMRQEGREIWIPTLAVAESPWLKTRELFVAEIEWHPTPGEKPLLAEFQKRFDWPNWGVSRLEGYADMVDAMGYNAIMLNDSRPLWQYAGDFISPEEGTHKVQALYRRARMNGMATSLFLWGQQGIQDALSARNCPRIPGQYADMKANWKRLLDAHGDLVDRWVLHWGDPGGCKVRDCTINTPQAVTNEFAALAAGMGPASQVTFSLWALRWGAWRGYDHWDSVVKSGILAPDIGIGLMRTYDETIAREVNSQHRKAGVWGWYLNDLETSPALHVHSRILEEEFSRVPLQAAHLLDWYSLEDNNHVLNLPSLYVGARMLWNPRTSAAEALGDFCGAVWGKEGPKVWRALQAIESVRCGPGEPMLRNDLWPTGRLCRLGRGSRAPQNDLALCEAALDELKAVKLDPNYVPKLPLIVPPQELLGYIRAHLEYVARFAAIRQAYHEALQPAREGRLEETATRMRGLEPLPDVLQGVYGAGEETAYFQILARFVDNWKSRNFTGNLAFGKPVTASSWVNRDPRFAPENAVNGILCEYDEEGWAAEDFGPAWLQIDLGSTRPVQRVRIYNRGYRREMWDNNLTATPSGIEILYASGVPREGAASVARADFELMGSIEEWKPTDNPADFREVRLNNPVPARWIKVVIQSAVDSQRPGCGEVEVF